MSSLAKKYKPAVISLDLRGRLVANYQQVFSSDLIRMEIQASQNLRKALAKVRKKNIQNANPDITMS